MDHTQLFQKVQGLSDLELSILVCLMDGENCIIEGPEGLLDELAIELRLSCCNTFGLSSGLVKCSEKTTVNEFTRSVLKDSKSQSALDNDSSSHTDVQYIPNVLIAQNLNHTHREVQVQVLELIRNARLLNARPIQRTPKPFLFIALLNADNFRHQPLNLFLTDNFFLSHYHAGGSDTLLRYQGFVNKEPTDSDSISSKSFVIHSKILDTEDESFYPTSSPLVSDGELNTLSDLASKVEITAEVRQYIHNIAIFLRRHRAVASGASAIATRHLLKLSQILAPLHGLSFVTPSLVKLAARKIYQHRVVITAPEDEISLQWGSSLEAIKEYLDGLLVEDVIEEVLNTVEVPL